MPPSANPFFASFMITKVPFVRGFLRLILDFEFSLYTCNSSSIYCRQLVYSFYESKIMTKQIIDFETSGLITDYEVALWSLLLLFKKYHQESYEDSNAFIWRLCTISDHWTVSPLDLTFLYPDVLIVLKILVIRAVLFVISLGAQSGYHQNKIR